ncbi:T9SS sorting signal type C domain-containing protein [Flavobacterium sp. UBA4854]|uniref:T9SS sorting signal type C domain-containing protein n=1 Tax=Flavobacterium sp. UBA4854 TaxID=1946548 RepID=UPI00257D6BA4|nr:T9SS sorting signal type C domain-containing protein [Flavobacterium sp. UBA4854]
MMRKLLYSFLFFISPKILSKKSSTSRLGLLCVGVFFVFTQTFFSQNRTSNAPGSWSAAGTWVNANINRTGTIASSTASNTVTGTSTLFLTQLSVGSVITTQGGTAIGTVASIASNTSLTLLANASSTNTGQTYRTTGGPPSPVDNVYIVSNHNVAVDGIFTCASLSMSPTSNNNTSTLSYTNSTGRLTVNGIVTLGENGSNNRRGALNMTNGGLLVCQGFALANTSTSNTFTAGSGTVQLTATNTLPSTPSSIFSTFNNLTISSGTTTFVTGLTINGTLSVASVANLGTGLTHTANKLTLGGVDTVTGSWGSTTSAADNQNNTYFSAVNGIVNVSASNCNLASFTMTGTGGGYCSTVAGTPIGLSGSETGVNYQLYRGTTAVGSAVAGTGNALNFGTFNTTGDYTIVASKPSTFCYRTFGPISIYNYSTPPTPTATVVKTTCPTSADGSITITNALSPASLAFTSASNQYVDTGSQLLSNRAAFTIEGWVKFDRATAIGANRMSLFGQNDAVEIGFIDGNLICYTAAAGQVNMSLSTYYPNDNGWHHIAVTADGTAGGIRIYVDGSQKVSGGSAVSNYGLSTYTTKFGWGTLDATGGGYTGEVFKLGFWNRALSATEVTSMASGFVVYNGAQTGLLAGYSFTEGTGSTTASVGSAGLSASSLTNSPVWTDPYSYSWTSNPVGFTATTKNITGLTARTYNLVTSLKGCTNTGSWAVTSTNPAVTASVSIAASPSATICSGAPVTFTATPVNGGTAPIYQWKVNGSVVGTNSSTYSSSALSNNDVVTCVMTSNAACVTGSPAASPGITMTVNPYVAASVSIAAVPSGAICSGTSVAFTATPVNGGAAPTYQWKVNGSVVGTNSSTYSSSTLSNNDIVTCVMTSNATCVTGSPATSAGITMTVNPKPTVANAGADQYGNGAFTLAANVPTAGTGKWSIASGPSTALTQFSNVNAANATFTPLGAGVYILNWTITTASCGSSTDDVVLSNCVGNLIQNGDFSNDTNNWSKATTKGTKVEVLKENVYFPNGNSENYTAELDVEASLGQTVSVIPNVPYTLSFIYARRPGSSPTVAVDVKIIDGSNTITRSYTTSDTTNSSVFQTIQFTPSTSSIWIEFYNSLETTTLGSIVDNIVLLPTSQVNPVATTTPKGKFKTVDACNGASVQLDVENVPASGVSYSWTTTSTGVTFSQTDIKNPKITVTGTGIKNATVVVTTTGGCSSVSSTTYVNVLALPVAGLVSNDADNTFCEGTSVTFTASGGTSYVFKVGSTTVQSGASATYTTTALTNGQTVTVDVTNASGCTSTSAGITNTVTPNNTITLTSAAGTDSQTVCANTAITNITYSTNGATGVNFGILPAGISGIWAGNVATISGTPTVNSTNSYNYTITLTGGCGTITATGTINVDSLPVGGSIAGGTTVCSGTGDTVLTLSGNSGTIAHWESSLDNFATAGTVINNTSTTLTASNLTATTSYRAVITNGVCTSVNSATATITVKALPTTPTITKNNNVSCGGFGIITLTDLPANWTINQTGLTTGSRSFSGTDSSVPIQNLTIDTYSFTVKDNTTGCTSNAATVAITDESSITEWTDSGWSNGEPDGSKSVVIKSVAVDQPFKSNKPNVVACSLIIDVPTTGPDVEIPSNVTLRITNIVKSNGKLVFKSGSSLVQKDNVQNDGDIVYIRATDVRRFDLTYWSSPIKSTKPEGFRMQDLSPTTYFDKFLYWSSEYKWATNLYGTLPMEVGKGYSIRGPQEFDNVDGGTFEGKFIGVPNNGNIDVTGAAVDKYFFLGNPYPSPIDVEKLWDANPDVLGPLYFWIHALLPQKAPGDNTARYSSNDYIICTASGSTDINGGTAPKSFGGFIAAGQGFFAKPKTTVIHFNNDMREGATENTNFFKTAKSSSIERNRIWLNIRNTEGAFKQILVGYIQGATNSVDFNYDAATLGANSFIDFYSINETKKLTIQGRALPFDNTDIVPLGYKSTIDSDFTIAIDHADGFFDKQEVYLEDKTTGKIINLRNENYTFSTLAGTFADRFVLRYTNKTLGTGDFENIEDSVLISVKNKVVSITSSKETIKDVNIFNVGAQLIYSKNKVNSSELQINNLHSSDQVLLVKVTLENGSTVSKKVVFSNLP